MSSGGSGDTDQEAAMTEFDDILANPLAAVVSIYVSFVFIAVYTGILWMRRRPPLAYSRLATRRA